MKADIRPLHREAGEAWGEVVTAAERSAMLVRHAEECAAIVIGRAVAVMEALQQGPTREEEERRALEVIGMAVEIAAIVAARHREERIQVQLEELMGGPEPLRLRGSWPDEIVITRPRINSQRIGRT